MPSREHRTELRAILAREVQSPTRRWLLSNNDGWMKMVARSIRLPLITLMTVLSACGEAGAPSARNKSVEVPQATAPKQIAFDDTPSLEPLVQIYDLVSSLSAAEEKCGLPPEPLTYNNHHPAEVDLAVIECLAGIKSPKTAWRSFLLAYELFKEGHPACESAIALKMARDAETNSIISSYLIWPGKYLGRESRPPFLRHPMITLSEAKTAFLKRTSSSASADFAQYISGAATWELRLQPYGARGLANYLRI